MQLQYRDVPSKHPWAFGEKIGGWALTQRIKPSIHITYIRVNSRMTIRAKTTFLWRRKLPMVRAHNTESNYTEKLKQSWPTYLGS